MSKKNIWVNVNNSDDIVLVDAPELNGLYFWWALLPFVGWVILIILMWKNRNKIKTVRSIEIGLANNGYFIKENKYIS